MFFFFSASSEEEEDIEEIEVGEGPEKHTTTMEMSPEFIKPLVPETKVPQGETAR